VARFQDHRPFLNAVNQCFYGKPVKWYNCKMTNMAKQKVTLNLPGDLVRAYRLAAVRQGLQDQSLIERALRQYLGLDALQQLQSSFAHLELSEDDADKLAVEAVRETRRTRASRAVK
jgi:hypothetical protein